MGDVLGDGQDGWRESVGEVVGNAPTHVQNSTCSGRFKDYFCKTTPKGFEPMWAEPDGFLVHHLNHSVPVSMP